MPIPKETIEKWKHWQMEAMSDIELGFLDDDTVAGGLAMEAVPALLAERAELIALLRKCYEAFNATHRVGAACQQCADLSDRLAAFLGG